MQFSLVLPCFNPPIDWDKNVLRNVNELSTIISAEIELIIVNDGSVKGVHQQSLDFLRQNCPSFNIVHHQTNKGKGSALRTGVKAASSDLTIFTDIDFPYTTESFVALYNSLQNGADVALGHRGNNYYTSTPLFRKLISKTLRFVLKNFLRIPTDDSQCGIKGFNRKGKDVFLSTRIERFLFDLEFIKLAARKKLNIKNVDVELRKGVVFSKVNSSILLKEAFNFIRIIFQ